MKAVLVIELDDEWLDRMNTTYDEMIADVTIYKKESLENQCDYSKRLYRGWCPLKPLPERKEEFPIEEIIIEHRLPSNAYASAILVEKAIIKAKQKRIQ